MLSSRLRASGRCFGAALLMAALCAQIAGAQVITSVSDTSAPAANQITASVGVSGTSGSVNLAGRFGIAFVNSTGGLLTQAASVSSQSYMTVRIDGGPPTSGADADTQTARGWDLIFGDVGTNALDASTTNAKTTQGQWVTEPEVVGNSVYADWETLPGGNSNTLYQIPSIDVKLVMRPVVDMVWYHFTVTNNDVNTHTIALRFAQAYQPPAENNGKTGPVTSASLASISNETLVPSSQIPAWWHVADPVTGDNSVGALLYPAGSPALSSVALSGLAFGTGTDLVLPLWDFTPKPAVDITGGQGTAALYTGTFTLAGGISQSVDMYFGREHASMAFGANNTSAGWLDGPVQVASSQDTTATYVIGKAFTATAVYSNLGAADVPSMTATLTLPPGLVLASSSDTLSKTVSPVKAGTDAAFTWDLIADGTASGALNYSVLFQGSSSSPALRVTRALNVPVQPSAFTATGGWQMVSFPFAFSNPDPYAALGLPTSADGPVAWDETLNGGAGGYKRVTALQPGQGMWINLTGVTPALTGGQPVPTTTAWQVMLSGTSGGWNQIGNPFSFPVRWGDVQVVNLDPSDPEYNTPMSVEDASSTQRKWLAQPVWWWDSGSGGYLWDPDFSTELQPFVGYWVKARKPSIELLIPVPTTRAAAAKASRATTAASSPRGWQVRLVATTKESTDGRAFVGVSSIGSDTGDAGTVLKPPSVIGHVSLSVMRSISGKAVPLAEDLRSADGGRKVWDIQIVTPQPNENVTLSWPEIATVPRSYELFLVDTASGQRYQMRQTSSVQFTTGPTGARAAQVVAEPRGAGVFRITTVNVATRARSAATIGFQVSSPANVTVRVLKSNGAPLRTLLTRSVDAGSTTQVTWDYRDAHGISLPTGSYLIEIRGASSDGQSDRRIVPYVLVR